MSSNSSSSETTGPFSGTDPLTRRSRLGLTWVHPREVTLDLSAPSLSIGRDATNDAPLDGHSVSRRHACIERRGSAVAVLDLDSRNGVFVDGGRVRMAPLHPGSVLRIGNWVGVVHRHPVEHPAGFCERLPGLFGASALVEPAITARQIAPSELAVLVLGETGTGKELVARAIHGASGRRGPFVPVNCAALADTLVDGALFGHVRGAFTGAERAHTGFIREADGGTLFLDEVAELTPRAQAKLLRAVEERTVTPVGSTERIAVDFRLVGATHGDLARAVREERFRGDLYARLEGAVVRLPSLRERREDILRLFEGFFRAKPARSAPAASALFVERLLLHAWPHNVRELRQLAERLAILHAGESELRSRHLEPHLPQRANESTSEAPPAPSDAPPPHTPENRAKRLLAAVREARGNVSAAARALGVSKQTLYRWIEESGLALSELRGDSPSSEE